MFHCAAEAERASVRARARPCLSSVELRATLRHITVSFFLQYLSNTLLVYEAETLLNTEKHPQIK